ncbi:MAG: hypothetical protein U5O39_11490 [Gammaproteobacteria bacterium]|nr:hypothetical protein [Gammaproteobacteria bacterium]
MAASVVLFAIALLVSITGPNDVVFGMTTGLTIALWIPWLTLALSLVTLVLTPSVIREGAIGAIPKLGYVLVVLSGLALSWFFYYWQVL